MAGDFSREYFEHLPRGRFGAPLRVLTVTASTNSDALEWAAEGAPEGAVVVADHQTAGRGRWGRPWFSRPGEALLFSLVLRPQLEPEAAGLLTTALGVAVARAVSECAGVDARLKWPNDVIVSGRKLAGMLVESRLVGARLEAAVAGVGVNVGSSAGDIPDEVAATATSLAVACAPARREPPRRESLLAAILASFESLYFRLASKAGAREVIEAASILSATLGNRVVVRLGSGEIVEGMARALDPLGALVLDTVSGKARVESGEVLQLRLPRT